MKWTNIKYYNYSDSGERKTQYVFKTKAEEQEYIDICYGLWCCVPLDVNWAINTNSYREKLNDKNK